MTQDLPTQDLHYVLLVDDEPDNLFLLEELLQVEGYQTRSVQSGAEALELVRRDRPALILLDVMMPGIDGFEVCQQLRADPGLQSIPIIFLTALDNDESRLRGLEIMGDDYLTKPVQGRLVVAKVSNTLRLNQLRQQSQLQLHRQLQEQFKRQMAAAWQISEALSEKFRLFVPEQFLRRIAPKGVESIQLGNATEAELTVLFCDIREFTAIAESQQVSDTFKWLNAFFQAMNQSIVSHHGFIDKYLGDAMLAVFDRPHHQAQDALHAAVTMRQALIDFNATRHQFDLEKPLNIGIGVHSGLGLIGTIGSDLRMDSTVIGDVVNTASRLEELTKLYGCPILASDKAIAQLTHPETFHTRWVDQVTPRGKRHSLNLYEVIGTQAQPIDEAKVITQAIFATGIHDWQQQNWAAALACFEQVLQQNPLDPLAHLYRERCQARLLKGDRNDVEVLSVGGSEDQTV